MTHSWLGLKRKNTPDVRPRFHQGGFTSSDPSEDIENMSSTRCLHR